MIYLEYKDFNELYQEFSRWPFYHTNEVSEEDYFFIGQSIHLNNVVIKSSSFDFNMDLSYLNYTKAKWTQLVKKYVDQREYIELKQRLIESTSKTLTFNFNIHKNLSTDKDKTKTRESCIVAMVFSRKNSDGP